MAERIDKRPHVLAVTGGIGSGKSVVCQCLAAMGIPVYACDDEAKRLNQTHPFIRAGLKQLVGEYVYASDGTLDKRVLADYLFADAAHAAQVNAIIHPCVKEHFRQWAAVQSDEWVVMESAILYESGFETMADKVIAVYAPEDMRIGRAMKRDGVSAEAVSRRIAQQMADEEKMQKADFILYNDGKSPLLLQILNILANLLCEIRA